MFKLKYISFLFILILSFAGCSSKNNGEYVKNIFIFKTGNSFGIQLIYYDFSGDNESYEKSEYISEDIYKLGIKAMNDKSYNFRLCENIYISPDVFEKDIGKAVYIINSLKVSPSANIICFTGMPPQKDINLPQTAVNPLYTLSIDKMDIYGSFPVMTETGGFHGRLLVKNSQPVKLTDKYTSFVLGILTNSVSQGEYVFRDGEMWAYLTGCCTHFDKNDDTLNINIDITMKEYKGLYNSIQTKYLFKKLLSTDIANRVSDIYNDIQLCEYYNLHWYCIQRGKECKNISVNVNIL